MEKQTDQKLVVLCIVKDVLKNIGVVLSLALSIAFIGYMVAKIQYKPSYTSSTTFVISQKDSPEMAYANMSKTQEMITAFQNIMDSKILSNRVCEDMEVDGLPGRITVEAVPETNLLTMSVTASRPESAFRMLKSVIKVYPEVGTKVLGEIRMEVFEEPQYPTHPDHAFPGFSILIKVFLVAFVLIAGMVTFHFYMSDTIKSEKEVKDKVDTALLGTLYHEKPYKSFKDFLIKKKKRMLLSDPAVSFLYEESVKKLSTKLLLLLKKEEAKVVLLTSTKSGEGKSTIAMNLAQDFANRGKKVLLIEGDLRSPGLSKVLKLGNEEVKSWSQFLESKKNLNEAVIHPEHYKFNALLNNEPISRSTEVLFASDISNWMVYWKQEVDLIIIDGPPARRRSDIEVWAGVCDLTVLVVKQNEVQAKYINDTIDLLEGYDANVMGCIYNDATKDRDFVTANYGYGYGYGYGSYGNYGHYGSSRSGYGKYGRYSKYGKYGKSKEAVEQEEE